MFPNDGKLNGKNNQSRRTNSSTSKYFILNSLHSNLEKLTGDLTKTLDDFFLGEENIHNRQHIAAVATNSKQESALKTMKKRDSSTGEVDIFSSSLIEVLEDIRNDIGNAGKAITSNALNLINNSSASTGNISLSLIENSLKEVSSNKLIEMEPCEFELSPDNSLALSTNECNQLEFEVNSLIEDSIQNDILVSSASEDSILMYSNGRYKITSDSSSPYDEEDDDMISQSPVSCKEHEGRPFEKVKDISQHHHHEDGPGKRTSKSGMVEHAGRDDDEDEGGVSV